MRLTTLLSALLVGLITPLWSLGDEKSPPSAAEMLDLVRRAQAKSAAREWKEAASLWQRATELNPVQPAYWYSLAAARYNDQDYKAAAPAFEKTAELGAPPMGAYFAVYHLARCHARLGDKEKALTTLERAMALGYPEFNRVAQDPGFASLRDEPRFKKLLGLEDVTKMTRDEGWRYDLAILTGEVHRKGFNPHLSVNRPVTREQFDAKARALHDAIPKLSDAQVVLEFMKLMAFLGDGHSAIWSVGENPVFRTALPLRFFWFEEGLFVIATAPEHKALLGAQVVAFDGRTPEELMKAMEPAVSRDRGNPRASRQALTYGARITTLLHAAGFIKNADRVTLTVRDLAGAARDVTIVSDAKEPNIWNKMPAPASWITFASTLADPPLYLRQMDKPQWFEYLAERKTVYCQFNKVRNDEKETLAAFSERLLKFIDEHDVEKLVIDMRWNNGGDTFLGQPLLLRLIGNKKVNQKGKFFVIIGRRTFSAAQNMTTYFERFTNATFVGEPTGSSPNAIGEEVPVTLPYSKLWANVSHLFWQSSWPMDQRVWTAPQVYVPPTFADFRSGRDRALESILSDLPAK